MRIICELTEWAEQTEGGSIGREGLQEKATDWEVKGEKLNIKKFKW